MLLKDLIAQLQELYDKEMEHFDVMGEPVIMIDVFRHASEGDRLFEYAGFSPFIDIERSQDGVYPLINAFVKPEHQKRWEEMNNESARKSNSSN